MNGKCGRACLLALLTGVLASGCSGRKVTEIVVSIATDLKIPNQLVAFDFVVYNQDSPPPEAGPPAGSSVLNLSFNVTGLDAVSLPGTIGLFPQGDPLRPITIFVTGRRGSAKEAVIWRQARLPFSPDRIMLVRMNLLQSCMYVRCPSGTTCKGPSGTCEDITEVPELYVPNFSPFPDGGPTVAHDGRIEPRETGLVDVRVDESRLDQRNDLAPFDRPPLDVKLPADVSRDLRPPDARPPDAKPPDRSPSDKLVSLDGLKPGCTNKWCVVAPGTFTMGSPKTEACRDTLDDEDQHSVTLTRWIEIGQYEVTRGDWTLMYGGGSDPSVDANCVASTCPVENLTWHMAAAYCNELSKKAALTACYTCSGAGSNVTCSLATKYGSPYPCPGYRLPTEAEWEFAARAGTTTPLHNGLSLSSTTCTSTDPAADPIAWYDQNASLSTKSVGTKSPNNWSLYDMAGNVSEWVSDGYITHLGTLAQTNPYNAPATDKACTFPQLLVGVRGGRVTWYVGITRSANRAAKCQGYKEKGHGFRCARSLTGTSP